MRRKSLYSVHNALTSRRPRAPHLELNPAVVVTDGRRDFALSVVAVGERLENDTGVALRLRCDGETFALESIHLRAEPMTGGDWLTVALYRVSRALLGRLAAAAAVEVRFGSGRSRLRGRLSEGNRGNVVAFLGCVDREDGAADRGPEADAGSDAAAAGDRRDADSAPPLASIAV